MRTLFRFLPMIALLAAPLTVFGGTSATMQVSFTVLASCTVDAKGATAPAVDCMQAGGFILAHNQVAFANAGSAAALANAPVTANGAGGWTVYF
jgi:hypothetical protein